MYGPSSSFKTTGLGRPSSVKSVKLTAEAFKMTVQAFKMTARASPWELGLDGVGVPRLRGKAGLDGADVPRLRGRAGVDGAGVPRLRGEVVGNGDGAHEGEDGEEHGREEDDEDNELDKPSWGRQPAVVPSGLVEGEIVGAPRKQSLGRPDRRNSLMPRQ